MQRRKYISVRQDYRMKEANISKDPVTDPEKQKKNHNKGGSKVATVIGVILCIILIPILIVNVTMIIKGYASPEKVPTFLGYSPMIVLTDSMSPNIKSGDLIIVKSVDAAEIKENDVISFFDPDSRNASVVTHRVMQIIGEGENLSFVTKGDANNAEDTPVPAANLVGIYKTRIGGAGNVAMFLQTTPGLIVSVALPMVLLIAYELIRRSRYNKSKDKDTAALLAELEQLRKKQAEAEQKDGKSESED